MRKLTIALALALGLSTLALDARPADACGGYVSYDEADYARFALRAFLGDLGHRVSIGKPTVRGDDRAVALIEYDAAGPRGTRVKVRQLYRLAKRDGAWKVVDWELPVQRRADPRSNPAAIARR